MKGTVEPLNLIVAMSDKRVIGKDGKLPWSVPEDMRHFKATTMGHAIIMGRKTYESIGRPLPGRTNIVLTRDPWAWSAPKGVLAVTSLDDALAFARGIDPEPFIIGGASVYAEALPLVTRIYLTIVHGEYEGDAFFPPLDASEWTTTSRRVSSDAVFEVWERAPSGGR